MEKKIEIIAVDFDGTLCSECYPAIGMPNLPLFALLKGARRQGKKVILWTCRCGEDLTAAVEWCKEHGLEFDYINENVPENVEKWGNDSRKIFAHEYIDDKATNPVKERAWIRRLRKAKAEKLIPAVIAVASIFAAYGVIAALNLLF